MTTFSGNLATPALMTAEIIFCYPEDMAPARAMLIELGFEVEVLDWVGPDPDDEHVWILASSRYEPDQFKFFDWVSRIVEPFRGDVIEAGDTAGMAAGMVSKNLDAIAVRQERAALEIGTARRLTRGPFGRTVPARTHRQLTWSNEHDEISGDRGEGDLEEGRDRG